MDHENAESILRRAVAGLDAGDAELEEALEHVEACEICLPRFELAAALASSGGEDMAEVPVEPTALFARALTAALAAPEAVARLRAARRLATLPVADPRALAALVEAAAEDEDEEVRAAALETLDTLDDEISLSERVIAAWAEAPAEAEPYLSDVLRRLAGSSPRVTALEVEGEGDELVVRGDEAAGRIERDGEEVWLRLNRLPGSFEKTTPVVAVPTAARGGVSEVEWSGGSLGLAPARGPVTDGAIEVFLGNLLPREALSRKLFERLYLLDPRKRRI